MEKFLVGILIGVIIGWLNPIEGPLDWTYDKYASQPSHKSPERGVAFKKEKKLLPIFFWDFEEEEEAEEETIPLLQEVE